MIKQSTVLRLLFMLGLALLPAGCGQEPASTAPGSGPVTVQEAATVAAPTIAAAPTTAPAATALPTQAPAQEQAPTSEAAAPPAVMPLEPTATALQTAGNKPSLIFFTAPG